MSPGELKTWVSDTATDLDALDMHDGMVTLKFQELVPMAKWDELEEQMVAITIPSVNGHSRLVVVPLVALRLATGWTP